MNNELHEVVKSLLLYAGKSMRDFPRPRNPCITARQAIVIADSIVKLIAERNEARAELEPYRIGVKHLHEELDTLTKERDALRAEVERLRAALTTIVAQFAEAEMSGPTFAPIARGMHATAVAALTLAEEVKFFQADGTFFERTLYQPTKENTK